MTGFSEPALVAVAHGSRDPAAVGTVRALLAAVRALRPGLAVRLGHVELNEPLLPDTLGALAREGGAAVLVPLLYGRGHHVTRDIPETLAAAPPLAARVAAPLGPHPLLADALAARLAESGAGDCDSVVLAAAGSRAARSAADTEATAALLAARLGVPVRPAYASAAAPTVAAAARALAARGHRRTAVACCFTAPGLFVRRTAAAARALGLPVAAPLGAHPALARLVLRRYDEQLTAVHSPAA
ncbi:sirohydrochlorin chelatase [Streptomyces sp. MAR4 CNX-425]|uniref:sirohydrochlorin chelatase n=1 Tax=Streptomyces sp. MAR4 CNX-425 TaxID=3406343 RepID=UPI003B514D3A